MERVVLSKRVITLLSHKKFFSVLHKDVPDNAHCADIYSAQPLKWSSEVLPIHLR